MTNDETMGLLDANAVAEFEQIDHALARIDAGDYGTCEQCQDPILEARLDLLPLTSRCADALGGTTT